MAPLTTIPGGNPVTELPGLSPRFPVMMVAPVLVTVVAPKTVKFCAAPSGMVWAAAGQEVASNPKTINAAAYPAADLRAWFFSAELFRMLQMQQPRCDKWMRRIRNFAGELY